MPPESARPAGVLGFDSSGGFYLQHSTPRFPDDPVKGAHKSSGEYTGVLPVDLPKSTLYQAISFKVKVLVYMDEQYHVCKT